MAIIQTKISDSRSIEIKRIITETSVGFEHLIEIDCKITAYKTSFYHFLSKFPETRKFKFNQTLNPIQWRITRIK